MTQRKVNKLSHRCVEGVDFTIETPPLGRRETPHLFPGHGFIYFTPSSPKLKTLKNWLNFPATLSPRHKSRFIVHNLLL